MLISKGGELYNHNAQMDLQELIEVPHTPTFLAAKSKWYFAVLVILCHNPYPHI